ncbi:MAG: SHOCT domain-containing protein [Actinomycetota bacterium]
MALWLVFLAAIVVGAILLVRALWARGGSDRGEGPSSPGDALRILEERYARGEIDDREFEERRRLLRS